METRNPHLKRSSGTDDTPDRKQAAAVSLLVAIIGAAFFAALAFQLVFAPNYPYFGNDIYDRYYLAIIHGRLDLPIRVLRYEGHYHPDGTGYIYHGIAPLLTRFALGWLVPLGDVSLAPFSIWLWAVVGTAAYHLTFLHVAKRVWPEEGRHAGIWALVLAIAVWFGSPGILLAVNISLYHEPIAVAYAATGLFVFLYTRYPPGGRQMRWLLVALALLAAITLHARPNVAIGLYLGTVVAAAHALWRQRGPVILPALLAMSILGAGGLGFLGLDELRFGSLTSTHGTFEASNSVYGLVYLGYGTPSDPYARAFTEHGEFNVKRILPNGLLYTFDPPWWLTRVSKLALSVFRTATEPRLGYIQVDKPRIGILFLWMNWTALAVAGLFSGTANRRLWILLLATATAALVTLAHGMITLRHRFDLWPVLAVLALSGLYVVVPRIAAYPLTTVSSLVLIGITAVGLVFTAYTLRSYTRNFQQRPEGFFGPWTVEHCIEILVTYPRLDEERARALCRPPNHKAIR